MRYDSLVRQNCMHEMKYIIRQCHHDINCTIPNRGSGQQTLRSQVSATALHLHALFGSSFILLCEGLEHLVPLGCLAVVATLPRFLDLGTASLGLVSEHLGTRVLSLALVDELHEHTLVLEHVALALHVEGVVQVAVDLLSLAVLLQETTQHPHAPHPKDLHGHTSVGRTLALSGASVSALAASDRVLAHTSTRVHSDGLADDEAILDQLADVLAGISVGDLICLVGIEPNLVLATFKNSRGEPLLKPESTHYELLLIGSELNSACPPM